MQCCVSILQKMHTNITKSQHCKIFPMKNGAWQRETNSFQFERRAFLQKNLPSNSFLKHPNFTTDTAAVCVMNIQRNEKIMDSVSKVYEYCTPAKILKTA